MDNRWLDILIFGVMIGVMERKIYNKLVRDKIPEIIKVNGKLASVSVLDGPEFKAALKQKLLEEAQEVAGAPDDELIDELADVMQLVESIAKAYQINVSAIEKHKAEKAKERGAFDKRLRLDSIEEL